MYLANYSVEGTSWLQAAAELFYPDPDRVVRERVRDWWRRFGTLLRSLDAVPDLSASLRVQLGKRMEAALFVVAPAKQEERLRRAIASFTQLDLVANGEIRFARERGDHDKLLHFPRFQCVAALPRLTNREAWFAFDFRVHPRLNELFSEARAQEHTLSYHVNIEPVRMESEWQREAARNALRVSDVAGVPPLLEQLEHDLVGKLRRATYVCEELLGVDSPAACEWLRATLERQFRETYGGYIVPEFAFGENSNDGSLTATRHRIFFETLGVDEICGAAVTPDERIALLSWQPAPELNALISRVSGMVEEGEPHEPMNYTGMPQPYCGTEPYAFISYKREDLERIKPLVAQLSQRGHPIWYDKGIPGGAEWDALIEERVQHCEVLLLFLSQASVRSKYVRREVKFADTLGKPIVGVRLEHDIDLSNGMAMLFNQYQVISETAPSPADEIDRAVRFVRLP